GDDSKAGVAVPVRWLRAGAARRPAPAPEHPAGAFGRSLRVFRRALLVIVLVEPVGTPLEDVAPSPRWRAQRHRTVGMSGSRVGARRPGPSRAEWPAVPSQLSQSPPLRAVVTPSARLVAQGLERQPAHEPHQLPGHRFKPFHQGPGFYELTLSR